MPLVLASVVVACLAVPHVDRMLAEWFRGDVELSASLIASSVEDRLGALVERRDIGACGATCRGLPRTGISQRSSSAAPAIRRCTRPPPWLSRSLVPRRLAPLAGASRILHVPSGTLHVAGFLVQQERRPEFKLFVVHDMGFAATRQTQARRYLLAFGAVALVVFGS